jgi:hypothetical protein
LTNISPFSAEILPSNGRAGTGIFPDFAQTIGILKNLSAGSVRGDPAEGMGRHHF